MTIPQRIQYGLEVLGALSALLGAVSHLPLGKFSAAVGELGVDLAGFVKVVRGDAKTETVTRITIPPRDQS